MAHRHVILGASLAGATAAITLREEGADGDVILIGAEPQPPYERPPLSKAYLRGEVPFDKALVRPAAFYAEHGIQTMFGTRATRIDPSARVVELEDHRRVSFDALLIATGGRYRTVSIPGVDLDGIYSLRTVQDADRIRAEMIAGRRAVVVGMGFIGSEVAASLRQKGLDVAVIDPSKTPLFRVLGEDVGQTIAKLHRDHGVRMIFEDRRRFRGNATCGLRRHQSRSAARMRLCRRRHWYRAGGRSARRQRHSGRQWRGRRRVLPDQRQRHLRRR